jgi:hypothetical protein
MVSAPTGAGPFAFPFLWLLYQAQTSSHLKNAVTSAGDLWIINLLRRQILYGSSVMQRRDR